MENPKVGDMVIVPTGEFGVEAIEEILWIAANGSKIETDSGYWTIGQIRMA